MTLPCSDASRARSEPIFATASRVERWVLVENCGAWGPPSIPLGRMDPQLAAYLRAEAARLQARLVLLRHPQGIECPPGRNVYVVDSRPGQESIRHRHVIDDDELLAAPLLSGDEWRPRHERLLLVCTHGAHDRCCAVRGRPVSLALSARWPEQTWECSHIGGDRFAPNVVVLPEGYYVGRIEADEVVDAMTRMRAGRLPVAQFRGRSSLPLPVQAAQHFARTELDRDGADDLRLAQQRGDGRDRWVVRLSGAVDLPDVEVRVRYDRAALPPAQLTCSVEREQPVAQFACEELRVLR